ERGSGNDRLLHGYARIFPGACIELHRLVLIAERSAAKLRQLASVSIGERYHHPVRVKVSHPADGVRDKAGLGLLAVSNYRRAGGLEAADGVLDGAVIKCVQL